jgi:hypothetical protein
LIVESTDGDFTAIAARVSSMSARRESIAGRADTMRAISPASEASDAPDRRQIAPCVRWQIPSLRADSGQVVCDDVEGAAEEPRIGSVRGVGRGVFHLVSREWGPFGLGAASRFCYCWRNDKCDKRQ